MTTPDRIDRLDLTRGVALLGIFLMNSVAFAMPMPAYYRVDAGGEGPLNVVTGLALKIFVDQKMMGLFALLFGASLELFIQRTRLNRKHPVWLSLWRNLLLAGIGLMHLRLWDGDVLLLYAMCAPLALLARKLPVKGLYFLAGLLLITPVEHAFRLQPRMNALGESAFGWFWSTAAGEPAAALANWLAMDGFCRALGMMLLGVALYRSGVLDGQWSVQRYRNLAISGLAIGLPIAAAAAWWQWTTEFSYEVAITSSALNSVAAVPITLGYAALIFTWQGSITWLRSALQAVGRTALSNYLLQSVVGVTVLANLAGVGRLQLLGLVVVVWLAQLGLSVAWLRWFRQGPVEWLWRLGTYLRWQPLLKGRGEPG